jgi:hypothetical protein
MTLTHSGASELAQLMEGTTAGALIPEIVRRGFQNLLEAKVSALNGAQLHERCPDQRSTYRNGYRQRLLVGWAPRWTGQTERTSLLTLGARFGFHGHYAPHVARAEGAGPGTTAAESPHCAYLPAKACRHGQDGHVAVQHLLARAVGCVRRAGAAAVRHRQCSGAG